MSKEIDEFYKRYSAKIVAVDDTPLVKVIEGGRFKMLSIEDYEEMTNKIKDLEAKLAESEKELKQYPYKNDVIEKQYEDLKDGIKFRIENNINDDWEQLYHCIDVLCEKHKARIIDIENSICSIEKLKQQLAESEKDRDVWKSMAICGDKLTEKMRDEYQQLKQQLAEKEKLLSMYPRIEDMYPPQMIKLANHDKISFAVELLEKVKDGFFDVANGWWLCFKDGTQYMTHNELEGCMREIFDDQIKKLKERDNG